MKTLNPHPHVIKLLGCVTKSGKGKLQSTPYHCKNRTLANSNLALTRNNFRFPSGHFLYNFTLDNPNSQSFSISLEGSSYRESTVSKEATHCLKKSPLALSYFIEGTLVFDRLNRSPDFTWICKCWNGERYITVNVVFSSENAPSVSRSRTYRLQARGLDTTPTQQHCPKV